MAEEETSVRSIGSEQGKEEVEKKNDAKKAMEEKAATEYKIRYNEMDQKLKSKVLEIYERNKKEKSTVPKMIEGMKKELESKYGTGWGIFAGQQFTGVCSHFKGFMIEFEADGNIFVVFLPYSKPVPIEGLK